MLYIIFRVVESTVQRRTSRDLREKLKYSFTQIYLQNSLKTIYIL